MFIFFETSRPSLWPTQPPIQWAPSAKVKDEWRCTFLPAIWCGQRQLYFLSNDPSAFHVRCLNLIYAWGYTRKSEVRKVFRFKGRLVGLFQQYTRRLIVLLPPNEFLHSSLEAPRSIQAERPLLAKEGTITKEFS